MEHISKHKLGLRERESIPGDGNCWYWTNCDLIKLHELKAPTDPSELRKAVTNSLKTHPLKMQWIKSIFMGKSQKYAKFVKEQSTENTFIDNYGIIVVATADYLGVNYHIVGTSNTEKVPVTKLHDDCPNRKVVHVGYYQDTTDQDEGPKKLGHYQSLEIVKNVDVPCCSIVAEKAVENNRDDLVEKIQSEEMVLKTFLSNRTMVRLSLERIHALPCVSLDELFQTNISHILYNDVRSMFEASTFEGKLCRKILKKFQNLCRKSPEFQDQDLPHLTDVSDEEIVTSTSSRSARSLFIGQIPRRDSIVVSEMTNCPENIQDIQTARELASSTVLGPRTAQRTVMSRIFEVSVSLPPEDCFINLVSDTLPSDTTEPSMTINSSTSQSQTEDPILTPPPCTPPHPAKRGGGRPALSSQTEDPILTPPPCSPPPPAKRGRGRPSLSSPSPPPAKRGRGRPRVQISDSASSPPAKTSKRGRRRPK